MSKDKKKQPARRSDAGVLAEKLAACELSKRNLEGHNDTLRAEIHQITTELESIRADLSAKDRRILSLGGKV